MVAGPYYLSLVASDRHFAPAMYKVTNSTFVGSGGGGGNATGITTGYNRKYMGLYRESWKSGIGALPIVNAYSRTRCPSLPSHIWSKDAAGHWIQLRGLMQY